MSRILIGFHGKLPRVGDFVQRRLPGVFVEPWEKATQAALAAASAAIGDAWRGPFLASPPWRFALAAEVCGRHPWVGVMAPSYDRVGRVYPLVLATSLPLAMNGWPHTPAGEWFDLLDEVIARGVEGIDVTAFDASVATLPEPHAASTQHLPGAVDSTLRSRWWRGADPAKGFGLPGLPDAAAYLRLLGVDTDEDPA